MAERTIPKSAQEAIEQGYVEATPDEIARRSELDRKRFDELKELHPDARRDEVWADCREPDSDNKTCFVSGCSDGWEFVYVCDAGICMKRAFKRRC